MSARSVVLSALLGSHPPQLPVAALVVLGERFGLAAGAIRTAVSRMVVSGDLIATDGSYQLAGRLLDRQRQQDLGRTVTDMKWDGQWWMVSALTSRRSATDRREFRSATQGAKLGELRPDSWMRPTNIPLELELRDVIVASGPLTDSESRDLCARLWNLSELARRADMLLQALDEVAATINARGRTDDIAPGFMVLAACLRFLRVEPQLPVELVGPSPAEELRTRYADVEVGLQFRLRELFRVAREGESTEYSVSTAAR